MSSHPERGQAAGNSSEGEWIEAEDLKQRWIYAWNTRTKQRRWVRQMSETPSVAPVPKRLVAAAKANGSRRKIRSQGGRITGIQEPERVAGRCRRAKPQVRCLCPSASEGSLKRKKSTTMPMTTLSFK